MLQNYTHNMGKNQNIDNIMGIIFLPKNPLFFKNQPFYKKKLCGVSILERNINILNKNGIRDIFILSNSSVDFNNEMNFDNKKFARIIQISNLNHVKENFNRKKKINSMSSVAVVLDGGVLIDDRIVSSLLNYEKDIIFIKVNRINSNNKDKNK